MLWRTATDAQFFVVGSIGPNGIEYIERRTRDDVDFVAGPQLAERFDTYGQAVDAIDHTRVVMSRHFEPAREFEILRAGANPLGEVYLIDEEPAAKSA